MERMRSQLLHRSLTTALGFAVVLFFTTQMRASAAPQGVSHLLSLQRFKELLRPPDGLFEIGLGYSYFHLEASGPQPEHLHGFDMSAFVNLTTWLSLGGEFVADFSHESQTYFHGRINVHSDRYIYAVGPRASVWPAPHLRLFAQFLAGGVHAEFGGSAGPFGRNASDDGFAMAVGLGGDWRLNNHFSWRIVQVDYLPTNLSKEWKNNWRVSSGIVYTFGPRK